MVALVPRSVVAAGIERRGPGFCARVELAGAALSHPIQRIASAQKHRRGALVGVRTEEKDKRGTNRNYSYISKYRSSITRACVSMLLFGEIGTILSARNICGIVDCN